MYGILPDLRERVLGYLVAKHEGSSWDFKREWYHDKEDMLHDIICMSNLLSDEDGLIIIGIDEEDGFAACDVSDDVNRRTTQNLVDFLREKHFAGGIRPNVCVDSLDYYGKTIDVIVVKNTDNTPYYLDVEYGKVRSYYIYTRIEDSNTPKNKSADVDIVEKLWKKRFGLDKTPIQRVQRYLDDSENWNSHDGGQSFFYEPFPEYVIKIEDIPDRRGYEYYCFSQIRPKPGWYTIQILHNQTVIVDTLGVGLDGGRLFTATPNCIFDLGNGIESYYGYIKNTPNYALNLFFLNMLMKYEYSDVLKWNECIPVFDSQQEIDGFVEYLRDNEIEVPKEKWYHRIPDQLENGERGDIYRVQYSKAVGIVRMLSRYREITHRLEIKEERCD